MLPPSAVGLEVGDVVTLEGQGGGPFEVTEIRDGAARRISARAMPPAIEAAIVTDRPRAAIAAPPPPRALPLLAAAHLPPEPGEAGSRLLLAASASPWPGHVAVHDDMTGARIARLGGRAALGELTAPLAPGPLALWDRANVLAVTLHSGHLAAADPLAVLAGANRIAVETDAGGWEVIGFAEAELAAPSLYHLRQLLRGQAGTDPAIGPAGAGNRVVVIDGRAALPPVPAGWVGSVVTLRHYAGTADPTGALLEVAIGVEPLLPLAPVHLRGARDPATGDVILTWVRRSRADTDSWVPAEPPLEAAPEACRVKILGGGMPVRDIAADAPRAIYAAAAQAADFGALPDNFVFTVSQLSPLYGAGHAATGAFHD